MSHPLAKLLGRHLRVLFAPEPLPADPAAPARARRGVLAMVFAPEPLPMEPELPRRRARWLAWLFLPERVDPDPQAPPAD